jgi:hypothetical protein
VLLELPLMQMVNLLELQAFLDQLLKVLEQVVSWLKLLHLYL